MIGECKYACGNRIGQDTAPVMVEDSRTIHVRIYPSIQGNWCVSITRNSDRIVIEGRYHDVLNRSERILCAMETETYGGMIP